jgi:phospholipase/carboxylesterase
MSPTALNGPEVPSTSGVTKRLVIFLHGYGADGNDLPAIGPMFGLPDTHFLSPHAPFPCEMMNGGYQWFSLMDRTPARIIEGITAAAPILNAYIDMQQARFGLEAKDIALVGFSQGSMMAMYTSLRRTEPLGAIVGISGALHGGPSLAAEITARPPICIIHGTADEVVPFVMMDAAATALRDNNVPHETHARPGLGHGIDEEGIAISAAFLKQSFRV